MDSKSVIALSIIALFDGVTGLEIVNRSEGELERGLVYVTLKYLEAQGMIGAQAGQTSNGLPVKYYRTTDAGIRALTAIQAKAGCAK